MGARFTSLDKFGSAFGLRIDEGEQELKTKMGASCTIMVFFLTMVYAGYRASILQAKSDVEVQASIQRNYYDDSFTFGAAQGFNIAVWVAD